tara:strand:+ start:175897 stop:176793 length:897 start_codon:yes stop_codon:yes gene_type:complete
MDPLPSTDDHPFAQDTPRVWTVFTTLVLALVLAVLFQILFVGGLVAFEFSRDVKPDNIGAMLLERLLTPMGFIGIAACGQLGFAIAGFGAASRSPEPFRQRIGWHPAKPSWRVYPVAMLASVFVLAVGFAAAYVVSKVIPADQSLQKTFDAMTVPWAIVFVLFIGIVPGVVEEVLFRGYMQQRLIRRWGVTTGIVVTSILFALVHITPHAIAAVVPLGFWLGYVAYRSGSILPGILCHFFVNAGLNAWRMVVKFSEVSESGQFAFHVTIVLIGALCFAVCLAPSFWRGRSRDPAITPS